MKRVDPTYALYETWMTDDQIRASFERSFGHPPEKVMRYPGGVNAGPVSEAGIKARRQGGQSQ